jgi:hypothetical protein
VDDLFPDTLQPSEVGIAGIPAFVPRFFALYPDAEELPEIVERQLRLCRESAPPGSITPRPTWMLHVSVALCGTPRRLRDSMEEALLRAQEAFCFPAFDVVLDSVAGFVATARRSWLSLMQEQQNWSMVCGAHWPTHNNPSASLAREVRLSRTLRWDTASGRSASGMRSSRSDSGRRKFAW